MAQANQDPATVVNYKVEFTTLNLDNGDPFDEPHTITGPAPGGSFNQPLNPININSSKTVVPLSTSTALGSYFLKFHKPQPNSSTMFVTFAQKNASMADGYYDYVSGIPADFRSQLASWITDGRILQNGQTYSKDLVFDFYGIDTNQVSSAVQYKVRFSTTFNFNSSPGGGTPGLGF
jgi:hypothetical protein